MENIRKISPSLEKKTKEEFDETPEKIKSSLKTLRDWIKEQPHLHSVNPPDQFLIAHLRGSKYNIEKCKAKLDTYYTVKRSIPELFGDRDPFNETIQTILKAGLFIPLKCGTEDGPKTLLSRLGYFESGEFSLADIMKVGLMVVEIMILEDDNLIISGEEALIDLSGIGFRLIMQWTPFFARRLSICTEKALSVRIKSIHILSAPFGIGGLVAIFKMFFGTKISNRVFIHKNDSLFKQIDKSRLPVEYGGTDGTIQEHADYWKAKVESYRDWFMDETAMADESKRKKSGMLSWF